MQQEDPSEEKCRLTIRLEAKRTFATMIVGVTFKIPEVIDPALRCCVYKLASKLASTKERESMEIQQNEKRTR